jgi:hypothetical protein
MSPESMTISQHLAELPASLVAASRMLRTAPSEVASTFAASVPTISLQTSSLAAFAVLLSGYRLRAEVIAEDGQATITFSRREDKDAAP